MIEGSTRAEITEKSKHEAIDFGASGVRTTFRCDCGWSTDAGPARFSPRLADARQKVTEHRLDHLEGRIGV